MSKCSPKNSGRHQGSVVRASLVSEKSMLESVVDFFQDVVPHSTHTHTEKEKIAWVRLEQSEGFCQCDSRRCDPSLHPFLVIIGYGNGVQVYMVMPSGEAQEVISLRDGAVKLFTFLGGRQASASIKHQAEKQLDRPNQLVAVSSESTTGDLKPFTSVKIISLFCGTKKWEKPFENTVNDILSNDKLFIVTLHKKIAAFDLETFEPRFTIQGCFPTDGLNQNPVSLGSAWLAFADSKIIEHFKSQGDMGTNSNLSYTATALNTAKTVTKGFVELSESIVNNFSAGPTRKDSTLSAHHAVSGVVTIVNVNKMSVKEKFELTDTYQGDAVLCHFKAVPHRVAHLQFDPSGTLLLAICREGQNFNLFRVLADPINAGLAAVQQLYVLHRGDTAAVIHDVTFSVDSRWVAVCTARGTTHVFAINPYGGMPTARTHTSQHVVNRASKFQKSAGLEEASSLPTRRGESPDSLRAPSVCHSPLESPRLAPSLSTISLEPMVRIKQPMWLVPLNAAGNHPPKQIRPACMAAMFNQSPGGKSASHKGKGLWASKSVESLYVVSDNGNLVEYLLEPHSETDTDKITDDTPLQLIVHAKHQWMLTRSPKQDTVALPAALKTRAPSNADIADDALGRRYGSKESISSDTSSTKSGEFDEPWLSQVEITTYSGPMRRLWMGPQFKFKTFLMNSTTASSQGPSVLESSDKDTSAGDGIFCEAIDLQSLVLHESSNPISMQGHPRTTSGGEIYIQAGSYEPPHNFPESDVFDLLGETGHHSHLSQTIADAMIEPRASEGDEQDLMMFPTGL